jgi:putative transposase
VRIFELLHTRFDTMAHYESALSDLAELLTGTDATLATSLADILAAAMQELIEAVAPSRKLGATGGGA